MIISFENLQFKVELDLPTILLYVIDIQYYFSYLNINSHFSILINSHFSDSFKI